MLRSLRASQMSSSACVVRRQWCYGAVVLVENVVEGALAHQVAALHAVDLHHPVLLLLPADGVDLEVLARGRLDHEPVLVVGIVLQPT
jgi:hypothetical protein